MPIDDLIASSSAGLARRRTSPPSATPSSTPLPASRAALGPRRPRAAGPSAGDRPRERAAPRAPRRRDHPAPVRAVPSRTGGRRPPGAPRPRAHRPRVPLGARGSAGPRRHRDLGARRSHRLAAEPRAQRPGALPPQRSPPSSPASSPSSTGPTTSVAVEHWPHASAAASPGPRGRGHRGSWSSPAWAWSPGPSTCRSTRSWTAAPRSTPTASASSVLLQLVFVLGSVGVARLHSLRQHAAEVRGDEEGIAAVEDGVIELADRIDHVRAPGRRARADARPGSPAPSATTPTTCPRSTRIGGPDRVGVPAVRCPARRQPAAHPVAGVVRADRGRRHGRRAAEDGGGAGAGAGGDDADADADGRPGPDGPHGDPHDAPLGAFLPPDEAPDDDPAAEPAPDEPDGTSPTRPARRHPQPAPGARPALAVSDPTTIGSPPPCTPPCPPPSPALLRSPASPPSPCSPPPAPSKTTPQGARTSPVPEVQQAIVLLAPGSGTSCFAVSLARQRLRRAPRRCRAGPGAGVRWRRRRPPATAVVLATYDDRGNASTPTAPSSSPDAATTTVRASAPPATRRSASRRPLSALPSAGAEAHPDLLRSPARRLRAGVAGGRRTPDPFAARSASGRGHRRHDRQRPSTSARPARPRSSTSWTPSASCPTCRAPRWACVFLDPSQGVGSSISAEGVDAFATALCERIGADPCSSGPTLR